MTYQNPILPENVHHEQPVILQPEQPREQLQIVENDQKYVVYNPKTAGNMWTDAVQYLKQKFHKEPKEEEVAKQVHEEKQKKVAIVKPDDSVVLKPAKIIIMKPDEVVVIKREGKTT